MKLLSIAVLTFISLSSAHYIKPNGKSINHDPIVVDCARFKREANQHSCVLSPFNTEGPYFIPDDLFQSDITGGQQGIPLNLKINLVNSNDCTPLQNMYVHLWHANALGLYSAVDNFPSGSSSDPALEDYPHGGRGEPGIASNGGRPIPISDERFGRGYQVTDEDGSVQFTSIIPGWYRDRCLHAHVEVYPRNTTQPDDLYYVGQIFFKRELPHRLKLVYPYSDNTQELLLNDGDGIFWHRGNDTVVDLIPTGNEVYAEITLGINPDAKKGDTA